MAFDVYLIDLMAFYGLFVTFNEISSWSMFVRYR